MRLHNRKNQTFNNGDIVLFKNSAMNEPLEGVLHNSTDSNWDFEIRFVNFRSEESTVKGDELMKFDVWKK